MNKTHHILIAAAAVLTLLIGYIGYNERERAKRREYYHAVEMFILAESMSPSARSRNTLEILAYRYGMPGPAAVRAGQR
jgi:hypothetical protein